jgi:hypothetical protein
MRLSKEAWGEGKRAVGESGRAKARRVRPWTASVGRPIYRTEFGKSIRR